MNAGDIIFVKGHSPFSKLVNYFDSGRFSHVCVAVSETHIFETDWYRKTTIRPFDYKDYEILELNLNEEEQQNLIRIAIQLTGIWYDYPQIAGYILKKVFSLKGKNKFNSPSMLICSEAIFMLLADIGRLDLVIDMDADITPNGMYDHLKKNLAKK